MEFDLESLRLIWWALLGFVMVVMVLCEGMTLGTGLLLPVLGEADDDRRRIVACMAPSCLVNLAWLIVLVILLFAAWPIAYAVVMASFYPLLLLVLLGLVMQPVLLYFLADIDVAKWRGYGYRMLGWSSLIVAALLGLLIGNLLKGVPYHLDSDMHIVFLGDFAALFNLFSMLVAATCVAMLATHGALFLRLKATGELAVRAKAVSIRAILLCLGLFSLAGLWITHLEGYHVTSDIFPNDASNPLDKFVKRGDGLWLDNYEHDPALWAIPAMAFVGGMLALWLTIKDHAYWAMLAGSLSLVMVVLTFGVSMFPFLLPSNISLNCSLTIWDSSSGKVTMRVLLNVAAIMLPLMLVFTRWGFARPASSLPIASEED